MDGWGVLGVTCPVRDEEAETIHLLGARVTWQLVPEKTEERYRPGIPRCARRNIVLGQAFEAMLENSPQRPRVCECGSDFVGKVAARVETEIARPLTGKLPCEELVEE